LKKSAGTNTIASINSKKKKKGMLAAFKKRTNYGEKKKKLPSAEPQKETHRKENKGRPTSRKGI